MAQFTFKPRFARRIPDPVFEHSQNIVRHVLFCPVNATPKGLSLDPNARVPNISKRVYKEIEDSLLDREVEQGTFHLKHKGITIVARSVQQKSEDEYVVNLESGDGILDGGHTYELLMKHLALGDLPENQYVKFEILTNIPTDWIADIAGGLNTSVQVQQMSLDALSGKFNWIKDTLRGEPYYNAIAWRENDPGDYDARDLVSIMTCFNIGLFPNDKDEQPVLAYARKSGALQLYDEHTESYQRLQPILKDILRLHDIIRRDSRDYYNESGGRFGRVAFVEKRERGQFDFPFAGEPSSQFRLMTAALYPMLAAFRWLVEDDPDTAKVRWRGDFPQVLELWKATAADLTKVTAHASAELGRNPTVLGKSRNHWSNLHRLVAMRDLMDRK
ncbi:MAG: AIPR family protein [Chloroflexota bacterium]